MSRISHQRLGYSGRNPRPVLHCLSDAVECISVTWYCHSITIVHVQTWCALQYCLSIFLLSPYRRRCTVSWYLELMVTTVPGITHGRFIHILRWHRAHSTMCKAVWNGNYWELECKIKAQTRIVITHIVRCTALHPRCSSLALAIPRNRFRVAWCKQIYTRILTWVDDLLCVWRISLCYSFTAWVVVTCIQHDSQSLWLHHPSATAAASQQTLFSGPHLVNSTQSTTLGRQHSAFPMCDNASCCLVALQLKYWQVSVCSIIC